MQTLRGNDLDGRYRMLEPVGRGGMATVWRARDLRLGRDVAVKLIAEARLEEPGFVERFEREAQIAAKLSHPNLVGVHDLRIDAGQPYLVMEFIRGETLEQRLERAPDSVDSVELARTLLDVLATIHDEGIVHRDLKPGNVMYQDDGRIRLTDFGIARIIGSSTITEAGHVIGTLEYMAPEVRSGEAPTPSADLYSLGVLLARCGADKGPLADLVRRLRSADPAKRPGNARLALVSIAGVAAEPQTEPEEPTEPVTDVVEPEPETEPAPGPALSQREPAAVLGTAPRFDREPTPASPPTRHGATHRGPKPALIGAVLAAIAGVVLIVALASGGGEEGTPGGTSEQAQSSGGGKGSEQAAAKPEPEAPGPAEATPAEPSDSETASTGGDPAAGKALNNEGYNMLQNGDPEGAVPVLEQAVASWPEGSDDIEYAYALYNLGWALTDAGRPEEAIPYLEKRLQWSDQESTVKAKLAEAKAAAG